MGRKKRKRGKMIDTTIDLSASRASIYADIVRRNAIGDVNRDRYWHDYYLSARSDGETVATAYRLMVAGV
jgi:hypothetical protein